MRWIFRGVAALLGLAVVAVALLLLFPTERIARVAESQFEQATGRSLSIAGGVSPTLWPRLGVTLQDVTISNADWAGDAPMVEAAKLDMGVGVQALIGGDVVVEAFEVEAPVIRLSRRADGVANWDFLTNLGGADEDGPSRINSVSLPKGTITGGSVVFADAVSGVTHRLDALDATLRLDDLAGAAQVDLSALLSDQSFSLSAEVNGLQPLLEGSVQGVSATLVAGENSISFDGVAGLDPVQAKGGLDGALRDTATLFSLAGLAAPRIPEGLGQRIEMAGNLTVTPDQAVFFRDATIGLDQNRLAGDVDVDLSGSKPQVTARLAGDRLDFSAMSTDSSQDDGAANVESGGWSTARLDVSGLDAVDGQFSFKANAVDLGSIQLGETEMVGRLERSRIAFDFSRLSAFDGVVSGQFVVNNRSGLSVGGDLVASDVAMGQVLADFAGFDRLQGRAGLELKFLGVGGTMDAIMRSLSGTGRMAVGAGALEGLDIAGMIANLDAAYVGEGSKTVFDEITAGFVIADGVLRNDDLAFEAKLATATGAGTLDLGRQQVEYRLIPVALSRGGEGGFSVPVLITGPWSDIRFRPDLKWLANKELEEEKAVLKAKARAKEDALKAEAEAKLARELGVEPAAGQGVEEAVKDKLEDKAKDALRKLFD